jgi:hypothetical protein
MSKVTYVNSHSFKVYQFKENIMRAKPANRLLLLTVLLQFRQLASAHPSAYKTVQGRMP